MNLAASVSRSVPDKRHHWASLSHLFSSFRYTCILSPTFDGMYCPNSIGSNKLARHCMLVCTCTWIRSSRTDCCVSQFYDSSAMTTSWSLLLLRVSLWPTGCVHWRPDHDPAQSSPGAAANAHLKYAGETYARARTLCVAWLHYVPYRHWTGTLMWSTHTRT